MNTLDSSTFKIENSMCSYFCIVSTDGILKMKKYEHIGFEHVQDRKFKEKVYEHDLIRYPKNKNQEQQ